MGCDRNRRNAADVGLPSDIGFCPAFIINYRKGSVDRCHTAGACTGDAEDAGVVAACGDTEFGSAAHIAVQIGDGVVAEDHYGTGHGHTRHTTGTHNRNGADSAGGEIELIVLYKTGDPVVSLLLVAVTALRLFLGTGVCMNLNLFACAERSVLVHAGNDIAVHNVRSQRRTNARDTAGKRACQHVAANQLIGKHMDVTARRDADAAADHRSDRALGFVLCRGNRFGFCQIRVLLFVYYKVFPAVCVVVGCCFVVIKVLANVSAFGIKTAVIVAKLDVGLLYAVAFQLARQTIHPVAFGVAAGSTERIVNEAVRVKSGRQRVGGILRQLAAGNGHHDGGADSCSAADCRGGSIADHIPFRIGQNVHAAIDRNIVLSCLAADQPGGNGVMKHADNCRHTHACRAAECAGNRDCKDLGIIHCGDIQLFRGNGHVLPGLGTGDLVGDDDFHRSGNRCRTAGADAGSVGGDELHGVRSKCYIAACQDDRVFAEFSHGAAVKPCDHCHRSNRRSAAAHKGCCHVEKIGGALGSHIHIAPGSHAAAKGREQIVFKDQSACTHANSRGAAAYEVKRQQVHIVERLCRCPDAAACAQLSAGAYTCLHRLVIDHGYNRGAYTSGAADRNFAGKVIYVCFVGAFYGSLRIVAGRFLRVFTREASLYDTVFANCSLDGVFEYQRVYNAADTDVTAGYRATDGCHHQLGVRVGADDNAPAFFAAFSAAVGKLYAAIDNSRPSPQGHVASDGSEHLILHNHGGNRRAYADAAGDAH